MPQILDIQNFISNSLAKGNIIDVRSEKEFTQGHIPGAVNIPLFNNEERAIVGTLYKKTGRQEAIIKGMEIAGPKMAQIVKTAQIVSKNNTVYVHCWRGGMRSGFVAMLLKMYGLNVSVLKGGYKAFRKYTTQQFEKPLSLLILGGKTGSGKTFILKELQKKNQQIIDLEGLAHHKGSAFGALGEIDQPGQEQFENNLAVKIISINNSLPVWIEDESRLIGSKVIPEGLWNKMTEAKVLYINLPFEKRLEHIVNQYGKFPKEELEKSIIKITKRIGPEQTKKSLIALHSNDIKTSLEYCLYYYDKTYNHGISKREKENIEELSFKTFNAEIISEELIIKAKEIS